MLSAFVEDNAMGGAEVTYAVEMAVTLPLEVRKTGVDFQTFCKLYQVRSSARVHA